MGYVHYYLRTAYQLLFGAMMQDPAGTPPLESIIQQSQVRRTVVIGCCGVGFGLNCFPVLRTIVLTPLSQVN